MRTLLAIGCCLLLGACKPKSEVVVFHAASLSAVFGELADRLKAADPPITVRLEPSGSLLAARKVTEQGLRADVVAVADDAILQKLIVPARAPRAVVFATNELVLAHLAHSPGTEEVTQQTWPEILSRPGVRLGRVDEDLAPIGYHTLFAWQLAGQAASRPGLAKQLRDACPKERVVHDEAELLALLEAKAVDYAFLYRSTAEDHRLKVTPLGDEVNLSRPELAAAYATASTEVRLHTADAPVRLTGRPISYALAVLADAPNPAGAKAFVELLASDDGRKALERHGFRPTPPPQGEAR